MQSKTAKTEKSMEILYRSKIEIKNTTLTAYSLITSSRNVISRRGVAVDGSSIASKVRYGIACLVQRAAISYQLSAISVQLLAWSVQRSAISV